MDSYLKVAQEVRVALEGGQAVVALESAVIAHGLPYPINLETARRMESLIRKKGAVPATIAVLDGQIRVGLTGAELEHLATAKGVRKVSRRSLPIACAGREDGATTVAATMTIAARANIDVFATGGIGGVHRDAPFDVSNDLPTLATVPVTVVCSGAKSILDIRATVEWLETGGVPILGYGTDEFPSFYSRRSGLKVDARVDTPEEAAEVIEAGRRLGFSNGTLVVVPVPAAHEIPVERLEEAVEAALAEARARQIEGSAMTPFLLRWVARQTEGASLAANTALLENNAAVAAQIAAALVAVAAKRGRDTVP